MKSLKKNERVGIILVILSLLLLLFKPEYIANCFDNMVKMAYPVFIDVGLLSTMSVSIVLAVVISRLLEKAGFTDGLMRLILPFSKFININATVFIPSVYKILGDINAAGRISGPILTKANATKDEVKIALCTMMQSQQSFSTLMLGISALTLAGTKVFVIIFLSILLPIFLLPVILRKFIWKDCKFIELESLPDFTPKESFVNTVFSAGQEGAKILFTLILPAFAVVFGFIGLLDHIGVWNLINNLIEKTLIFLNIEPITGLQSILASPTLAMQTMKTMLEQSSASIDPRLVIGGFILATSGFPVSVIFGQNPLIWSEGTMLSNAEAMGTSLIGAIIRLLTAGFFATVLYKILI